MVIPLVCDTWSVRRQTYGYLPSRKASPPIGWYQIIMLGDRGTCVLTTCPGLHSIAERPGFELATYWSQVQRPNHSATEPHYVVRPSQKNLPRHRPPSWGAGWPKFVSPLSDSSFTVRNRVVLFYEFCQQKLLSNSQGFFFFDVPLAKIIFGAELDPEPEIFIFTSRCTNND